MQLGRGIVFFSVAVIAVTLGEPLFDKLHPNRDERFQIKNAGKQGTKLSICTGVFLSSEPFPGQTRIRVNK